MQGMKKLTRQDLIDLIDKNFSGVLENDVIATFFYVSDGYKQPQQQCILFRKELENN